MLLQSIKLKKKYYNTWAMLALNYYLLLIVIFDNAEPHMSTLFKILKMLYKLIDLLFTFFEWGSQSLKL